MHLYRRLHQWPRQENFKACFRLIYDTHKGGIIPSQSYGANKIITSQEQRPWHWKNGWPHRWGWKKSIFIKKIESSAETSLQMLNSTWHRKLHQSKFCSGMKILKLLWSLPLVRDDHCYWTFHPVIQKDRTMWFIKGLLHNNKKNYDLSCTSTISTADKDPPPSRNML